MKFKSIKTILFLVNSIVIIVCVPILVFLDHRIHHERAEIYTHSLYAITELDLSSSGVIDAVTLLEEHILFYVTTEIRDYEITDGDDAYSGTLVFYLIDSSRPDGLRYSRFAPGNNEIYIHIETCIALYTVFVYISDNNIERISITEIVYMDSHIWSGWDIYTKPTCIFEGVEKIYCQHPDCPFYWTRAIAASGHTPGDKIIANEPTCAEKGRWEIRCDVCDDLLYYGEIDAPGHDIYLSHISCMRTHSCERCDYISEIVIDDFDTPQTVNTMFVDTFDHWAHYSIMFVSERGNMQGIGNRRFAPDEQISRAMVATILWRLAGEPAQTCSPVFTDVMADQWYSDAIVWATQTGVVQGLGDGRFDPHGNITREQFAAMFYRYTARISVDTTFEYFCLTYGLSEEITRAQAAAALHRFIINIIDINVSEYESAYYIAEDYVPETSSTYYIIESNTSEEQYIYFITGDYIAQMPLLYLDTIPIY